MKKFSVFSRKKNNTKTETEEETAVPSAVEPPAEEEVAAASPTTTNEAMSTVAAADQPPPPADHHEDHGDVDEEDDDDEALDVDEAAPKEWDEGGKSHCGYSDQVHDTLMLIGESIHKVVGEPNATVQSAMNGIGSWFQEASYAARDVQRGKMNVGEEAAAAIKSMVTGDEDDAAANGMKEDGNALLTGVGEEEGGDQVKGNGGDVSSDDQRI